MESLSVLVATELSKDDPRLIIWLAVGLPWKGARRLAPWKDDKTGWMDWKPCKTESWFNIMRQAKNWENIIIEYKIIEYSSTPLAIRAFVQGRNKNDCCRSYWPARAATDTLVPTHAWCQLHRLLNMYTKHLLSLLGLGEELWISEWFIHQGNHRVLLTTTKNERKWRHTVNRIWWANVHLNIVARSFIWIGITRQPLWAFKQNAAVARSLPRRAQCTSI